MNLGTPECAPPSLCPDMTRRVTAKSSTSAATPPCLLGCDLGCMEMYEVAVFLCFFVLGPFLTNCGTIDILVDDYLGPFFMTVGTIGR